MCELRLEPIERSAVEIREDEGNSSLIVRKISGASSDVHGALEDEGVECGGVRAIKCVRTAWFRGAFRGFGGGDVGDVFG
jgi:hypothetical protein